jgi:uncharacterized protein YwlG (UPF0340 family)
LKKGENENHRQTIHIKLSCQNHRFDVFKEVGMQAGYRMGNTPVGNEVARVKRKVEPGTKKVGNTKITLRTNAAGEKEVAEIQVAGESFKHLL